ncbi:transcriptional regulator NrdR [Candidatus Gottesmanbacteria bacterium RIFCSPHIGHO2_02_FULL_40_24]|uniref:Transcriptional repressor NrdR n=1 Tax=Candidatus Gottesmanbacteria bacterium RIFCSPHIGHO2_01_FULL_40_15 TaxID=1798376 RepID=A0A1F5Z617_9BACT|nr:MAG: transcriptional regulator NrdR [Candidatus Gottesmanbacteria bacterium RIFCSPHIGHO2_01_FULL_40_15]OGG18730.1 MAG: transcriptional regulator NrdR [Candidatus Gottesmanbacteria bacterium RIFCSPHIGHO2_02_FULL_40_24]OGG20917.1 MAG: transcriptional regulator NrdR [Candidatus Gottesmanbacteria bacterium RIFCSPLOWO2_01_FULL_40_10]OGG23021.1 MAG: transcriptional regulator NrdR [Candidatus Gottesmanbacteria bacterium RIFCSPHIGHO2_12_FULL_40_13]
MRCPFCDHQDTEVVETRDSEDLTTIRRRRECTKCNKRFTTYERVERVPLIVIKKDGRKDQFDRDKLKRGILKSCEKTIVGIDDIDTIVDDVEKELRGMDTVEVESKKIGQLVAQKLKKIDKIAYIRFASVFRRFVDVEDFEKELQKLL